MVGREAAPSSRPMVAKAASYSPSAMPMPIRVQAAYQPARFGTAAISARPAASTTDPAASTSRPPMRSISRPMRGAAIPLTSSAQEKPPSSTVGEACMDAATAPMTIEGR